jgi:hypothetical protein
LSQAAARILVEEEVGIMYNAITGAAGSALQHHCT